VTGSPKLPIEQRVHRLEPSPHWEGRLLRDVLREAIPALSSRAAMLVVANGLVSRGGVQMESAVEALTAEGGAIEVDLRHGVHGPGSSGRRPLSERMKVLYDDDHIVVVEKGAGVLVAPTEEDDDRRHADRPLVELLKHYWKVKGKGSVNPILVQRLDRETSGLMVLAKTVRAARSLQDQLIGRRLKRIYNAVVHLEVIGNEGTWRSMLGRGENKLRQSIAPMLATAPPGRRPIGQTAVTHWRVAERGDGCTLLDLELETGRTHQIRIHCAEAGHPVVGDRLYHHHAIYLLERAKRGELRSPARDHPFTEALRTFEHFDAFDSRLFAPRLCLHAAELRLTHPITGKRLEFEAPGGFLRDLVQVGGKATGKRGVPKLGAKARPARRFRDDDDEAMEDDGPPPRRKPPRPRSNR
jgi:23S rRNA pseudouridine1911/1915/1917 synthase